MSYTVYSVSYSGIPLDHVAIFVETHENDPMTSFIYHVSGSIQQGKYHDHKPTKKPEDATTFVEKEILGKVSHANYGFIRAICDSVPPPKKQFCGAKKTLSQSP